MKGSKQALRERTIVSDMIKVEAWVDEEYCIEDVTLVAITELVVEVDNVFRCRKVTRRRKLVAESVKCLGDITVICTCGYFGHESVVQAKDRLEVVHSSQSRNWS